MKLRNKKTGEVIETDFELSVSIPDDEKLYGNNTYTQIKGYNSIKELSEEWEDYEEPSKTIWQIKDSGELQDFEEDDFSDGYIESSKSIGNYFDTREEAEKAVEKLKAWKRLKDKGFKFKDFSRKFDGFGRVDRGVFIVAELDDEGVIGMLDDLNICFGGEE